MKKFLAVKGIVRLILRVSVSLKLRCIKVFASWEMLDGDKHVEFLAERRIVIYEDS